MHLKEIGCEGVEWIQLAQDSVDWYGLKTTSSGGLLS